MWLSAGCVSWYRHNRTGRLTLLWPGTAAQYATEYGRFHPAAFHLESDDALRQPAMLNTAAATLT